MEPHSVHDRVTFSTFSTFVQMPSALGPCHVSIRQSFHRIVLSDQSCTDLACQQGEIQHRVCVFIQRFRDEVGVPVSVRVANLEANFEAQGR